MTEPTNCPTDPTIAALLAGSLPADEAEALTAHLEACVACRQALDRLAGVSDSWPAVARRLAQAQTPQAPALQEAMAELRRAEPDAADADAETVAPETGAAAALAADVKLGHYEVRGLVGEGGMGRVYRAFDPVLHRVVAIKVMAESLAASGSARQRFMREARAAAVVAHDNVVVIHEVNESGPLPYLVMQFVSGTSLQERIDRGGPLPLKDLLRIGMQTALGLAAAHKQGLVHRDVKPANILLENGVERVKLTDFGLARAVDDASLTQSGVIAGTPQYMSPEQANGEYVDHRSDLFSLGSVLYAMATGRPPFRASNTMGVLKRVCEEEPRPIREINPELPQWLEEIVARLMTKDVKGRFQSADEVAGVLTEALSGVQAGVEPRRRPRNAQATATAVVPKKRPALAWLLAGLGAVLGLGLLALVWGVISAYSVKRPNRPADPEQPAVQAEGPGDGWMRLFNGKDLTGWKTHPREQGRTWRVEDGQLSMTGAANGHLFTERGDFTDFHLRIEARCAGDARTTVGLRAPYTIEDWGGVRCMGSGLGRHAGNVFFGFRFNAVSKELPVGDGDWFVQDVILRGENLTVKLNGAEVGSYSDPFAERAGHVVLTALPGQVHFRKIEIKELRPDDVTPFVVLAKGQRVESRHASLAGAVNAAGPGDTIEVRGDGPFVCEPIDLGTKPLAIRAGPNALPVLTPKVTPGADNRLLDTRAPLALEGLSFVAPAPKKGKKDAVRLTFVTSRGSSLLVTHCQFVVSGEAGAVTAISPVSVELRHSACLGHPWHSLLVCYEESARALVADCITGPVSLFGNSKVAPKDVALTLERNTLVNCAGAPLDVRFATPEKVKWPDRPPVHVAARRNVTYGSRADLIFVPQSPPAGTTAEQAQAWLKRLLFLEEDGNLHRGRVVVNDSMKAELPDARGWQAGRWREFWGQAEGAYVEGEAKFVGAITYERLFWDPGSLTTADFRLAKDSPGKGEGPGGRDLGADVDRVGPGRPYAEWQKTPDYAQWQKMTRALLDGRKD